jgi:2-oxoglutarate dehydrogenase E1 component
MQLVYPTTPANVFHALRRQIHRDFRKPLILFFSKSLLRHPLARSNIEDFTEGTKFIPYIPDPHPESLAAPEDIKRHILCSGQVYYQLLQERENRKLNNVAISRVEQLSPVPYALITPHLDTYPNADIMWVQEEPINNAGWSYMQPRLETAFGHTEHHKEKRVKFAGRGKPSRSVEESA